MSPVRRPPPSPRGAGLSTAVPAQGTRATLLLAAITVAGLAAAAVFGWQVVEGKRANAAIRDLAAGRDRAIDVHRAPAELLLARADFLVRYERVDEAEALIDPLSRTGRPALLADLWFAVGNGRMAMAFAGVEDRDLDEAVPQVAVAKEAYRRTLALLPDAFDAKVNLDVAMRLVRDFPEHEPEVGDAPPVQPKNLWTDLPGLPRGLP
mgnify:CR=1 FL=1